ncbi:MAG: AAA family ATPase, partial [Thermodesulfobacteriota bacterium]|nr:AAA family ATPase [Thermodesulfobacteriota bacterium]
IQIIDCIEFNDRFRYGDAVLDLSFLHMDLEHLGYPDWSLAFLAEYAARAHDLELYALVDFYAAYRSIVRLKVSCLRSLEVEGPERRIQEDEARLFMKQAYRYAIQLSRPTLWLFCGLPATGKSLLAANVAKTLSIPLFQSDAVRGQGRPEDSPKVVPFGQGLYRANMRGHVYAQMLALAQEALKGGHSVILDATFAHRHWREEARRLAADLDTNLVAAECVCPKETIISRLRQRETEPGLSDARLQHFEQLSADFEPIDELAPNCRFIVNTGQPLDEALGQALSEGYARQCAQVKEIL